MVDPIPMVDTEFIQVQVKGVDLYRREIWHFPLTHVLTYLCFIGDLLTIWLAGAAVVHVILHGILKCGEVSTQHGLTDGQGRVCFRLRIVPGHTLTLKARINMLNILRMCIIR